LGPCDEGSIAFDPVDDVPRSSAECEPRHERACSTVLMATLVVGPFYPALTHFISCTIARLRK
jgi:hypothetical protein